MVNIFSEQKISRRIERMMAIRQRRSRAINFVVCAAVLILGIAFLLLIVKSWFVAF